MVFLNIYNCANKTLFANPVTYKATELLDSVLLVCKYKNMHSTSNSCNMDMKDLPDSIFPCGMGRYLLDKLGRY